MGTRVSVHTCTMMTFNYTPGIRPLQLAACVATCTIRHSEQDAVKQTPAQPSQDVGHMTRCFQPASPTSCYASFGVVSESVQSSPLVRDLSVYTDADQSVVTRALLTVGACFTLLRSDRQQTSPRRPFPPTALHTLIVSFV
jgi:hypothetical protein